MKLSVQATRKEKLGLALESSLTINQPAAEEGLGIFFMPVAKPDQTIDLTTPFVLRRDKMRWCRERVTTADLAHQIELGKQAKLFKQRDELTRSLGVKLVKMRSTGSGLLDEGEFAEIGLVGPVSNDPTTVHRQGRKVLLGFAQKGQQLESPGWQAVGITAEPLIAGIATNVEALGKVLEAIAEQKRLVQGAAAARERAFAEFNTNYLLIGRWTEASLRMAGLDMEADRARPSVRRLTRSDSGEIEPEETQEVDSGEVTETVEETGDGETPPPVAEADTTQ